MDEFELIARKLAEEFGDDLEEQVIIILVKEAFKFISRKMKKKKG